MLHLANMATLGHWLRALVIALVAMAGGIGCNNGLAAVTASRMSALVATAGGIGCYNGLVAVMAGRMRLAHWLQWPAALAVIVA